MLSGALSSSFSPHPLNGVGQSNICLLGAVSPADVSAPPPQHGFTQAHVVELANDCCPYEARSRCRRWMCAEQITINITRHGQSPRTGNRRQCWFKVFRWRPEESGAIPDQDEILIVELAEDFHNFIAEGRRPRAHICEPRSHLTRAPGNGGAHNRPSGDTGQKPSELPEGLAARWPRQPEGAI